MAIDSKRIAKNTIFLYIRLALILVISLFSSRVTLDKLGATDYGLHGVVYSIIGMLSFLNATLSSGTSRFITFELGRGDIIQLKNTFNTALLCHILLALLVFVIGETVGLWYLNNIMNCPPERIYAVKIIYQISIFQTMLSIIQVPFTSEIMAHECMDVYAYVGIFEAFFRLLIIYALCVSSVDKLVMLSIMTFILFVIIFLFYIYYTRKKFQEVRISFKYDRNKFKSIITFSGWNIIANVSNTLMSQGVIMLFNLFFSPVVVAAQSISNNISRSMMQFVDGVRQAINPQVIKLYAAGKFEESKSLTLQSAEYVFDLLLLLGIPLILIMPDFMSFWLVDVPEYAVIFTQLIILQDIFGNFSAAFYTPMVAANKIKKNTYASIVLCLFQFALLYVLFKIGLGPVWARILGIVFCLLWSFLVKPFILWKDLEYNWNEMLICIVRCLRTFIIVALLSYFVNCVFPRETFIYMLIKAFIAAIIVILVSLVFMSKKTRSNLIYLLYHKISRKR